MRWTLEQEKILFIYGYKGAEYCRKKIHKEFGIYRSIEATQRHASRIGAPMIQYEICPKCGQIVKSLNHRGLCKVCHYEELYREQLQEEHRIRKEIIRGGEGNAYIAAKRSYNSQRQKVLRLKKSISGDFVNMSEEMSSRRSEATEIDNSPSAEKKVAALSWN